ncbi:probable serine/threonine-protein kinase DDB_G0283337 [Trichoplusia ni]|uniref:Probable serine/threonine-protein kinase DDB_G0283337 n=1 Tax=Trichoplusia ni TaxID=7111 RepID=A0A7E5VAW9_TRINI|nr:probable serine/threonine-protein kinase DDB_G0283337 [Trichoplusia ni]
MSRPYNEEWQRRKSMLVKSLFYDLPVLSPIPEESFSSNIFHTRDVSDAPSRPYSPLPPLIIEREPDRHDEPEEYYKKLLKKIKRIYRKLFIENKSIDSDDCNITGSIDDLTDDDFNENDGADVAMDVTNVIRNDVDDFNENYASDVEMDVTDVNQDELSTISHITINSDGYNADFESSNESVDGNSNVVEGESNNLIDNHQESEDEDMDEEKTLESNNENINHDDIYEYSNNINGYKEMIDTRQSDNNTNESNSKSQGETVETNSNPNQDKITDVYIQSMDITGESNKQLINEKETSNNLDKGHQIDEASGLNMDIGVEERGTAQISEVTAGDEVIRDEEMDVRDDEADDTFDTGIDYRQITTVALVHVDGAQQNVGRVSPVYETVTSPILPPGVVRGGDIRGHAVLEDVNDPEKTSSHNEASSYENIEQMRTPRTELSIDSNNNNHYNSNISDQSNKEQNEPQIENNNNLLEVNNSNEINDVLTSFINSSREMSLVTRKRKMYEDISCQTIGKVSWDDVKENFFVGPPKIFRLCRCVDHDCSR